MATMFKVEGPFTVPCYQGRAGRTITDENIKKFWGQNQNVIDKKGCYVFGIRAAGGFIPAYVGKATKAFKQEAFASHKLAKYQQFLADYRKGTPVLFFAVAPNKQGATNISHINGLEDFLIQAALAANPDLLNIKGTKAEEWGIAGVLRGGQGKASSSARNFRKMMKIKSR